MPRRRTLRWLDPGEPFPDVAHAWREPNGLLAASADLDSDRLEQAYRLGIFPWYGEGQPVLWWSPDPRMVLFTEEFRVSDSLRKRLRSLRRSGRWRVTMDRCFERVMRECASPRRDGAGTWITEDIVRAYVALHQRGLAHSVEVWERAEQRLIGGLYGVAIGRMFYGESMFARVSDASKVALAAWVAHLRALDFRVIDCQQNTGHLASLGAREIRRSVFLNWVARAIACPLPNGFLADAVADSAAASRAGNGSVSDVASVAGAAVVPDVEIEIPAQ